MCTEGWTQLTKDECISNETMQYAKSLKPSDNVIEFSYITPPSDIQPKGCFLLSDGNVKWNSHPVGGNNSRAKIICKAGRLFYEEQKP